jgi:hypothetical protein
MAIIGEHSRCAICGAPLTRLFTATSGCAFPPDHRLFRFCDAPLHLSCLEAWADREEFARAYYDQALGSWRRKYGTLLHETRDWSLGCGPATPPAFPYYAEVRLSDWPIRLYSRLGEWDAFVAAGYRAYLEGAALSRADAVMGEVRALVPDQQALRDAWMARAPARQAT